MRTQKRHTPDLLDRFKANKRGIGTAVDYVPWHRVSRGDPSSHGRSHLLAWRGRHIELLSDLEWVACSFAIMAPGLIDLREQFPLSLEEAAHELAAYDISQSCHRYPGSRDLAQRLGIVHPRISGEGVQAPWVMTTDLLLTLQRADDQPELLAVACKCAQDIQSRRTVEKLRLEQAYWKARGVRWLLITPTLYEASVGLTLRRTIPWGLEREVPAAVRSIAVRVATACAGHTLTHALARIAEEVGALDLAQTAFWQAVWRGELTLDLRHGWRPHRPVVLMAHDDFYALNPIVSRRSAWTN